jgi:hypothetical protein
MQVPIYDIYIYVCMDIYIYIYKQAEEAGGSEAGGHGIKDARKVFIH